MAFAHHEAAIGREECGPAFVEREPDPAAAPGASVFQGPFPRRNIPVGDQRHPVFERGGVPGGLPRRHPPAASAHRNLDLRYRMLLFGCVAGRPEIDGNRRGRVDGIDAAQPVIHHHEIIVGREPRHVWRHVPNRQSHRADEAR
jgi:hypothetical protein